jgi:hypothetical protein
MAEPTNAGPSTQSNRALAQRQADDDGALFVAAHRLMDEARPLLTVAQGGSARVGYGPVFNVDLTERERAIVDLDNELTAAVAKALRRGMSEEEIGAELQNALRNALENVREESR